MSDNKDAIQTLCDKLNSANLTIDTDEYTEAIEKVGEILKYRSKVEESKLGKIEEVITRSYQDHSESRALLAKIIKENIANSLDLFEKLSLSTIHVLVGVFNDRDETLILVRELKSRLHYGEDNYIRYLLSIMLQLLAKFEYKFKELSFLVRDLALRAREPEVTPMMLLIFAQLHRLFPDEFGAQFLETMDVLIMEAEEDIGNDPLCLIVEILTELYPSLTTLCSAVLIGKGADRLMKLRATSDDEDLIFRKKLLTLLSAACIDEAVRTHISENYVDILETSLKFSEYKVQAALVLIKTWSFVKLQHIDVNKLAKILVENFINDVTVEIEDDTDLKNKKQLSLCIEGLAYLTLKVSIKRILRIHEVFTRELVKLAKKESGTNTLLYGILIIFANLSAIPNDKSDPTSGDHRSKSIEQLGMYASMNVHEDKNNDKIADSTEEALKFQEDQILAQELLSDFRTKFGDMSLGSKQQVIRIAYNLTREKKNISKCVQQGVTTCILEYLVSKQDQGFPVRMLGYRSLTRILISTNPELIFNKYSPLNAVPFLFDLVAKAEISASQEESKVDSNPLFAGDEVINVVDQYEALLALTNLASTGNSDGEEVCKVIANREQYWSLIVNLMLDENPVIQRSTLELISNLMSHPLSIAARFFNFANPQSVHNFNILVQLIELEDIASQRAIAAIFANIVTTIPFIAEDLLDKKSLIEKATGVFHRQIDDVELRQRLLIFFYGLFEVNPEKQENQEHKQKNLYNNELLKKTLLECLKRSDTDQDYKEAIPPMLELMGK